MIEMAETEEGVIGIDGCKGGWIAVCLNPTGSSWFKVFECIEEVLQMLGAGRPAMIDMPIGLPGKGYRACDLAARRLLGRACSRVFLGARRFLLRDDLLRDYPSANAFAKAQDGKGIAKQLFCILPKIKEVDDAVRLQPEKPLRETHPELVFFRLNGNQYLEGKKTIAGQRRRLELLEKTGCCDVGQWCGELRGKQAKVDDLLDACAAALAARGQTRLVCAMDVDAVGLPMAMWY